MSYYSMAEGRVRNEGGGFGLSMKMEYFITDQQGNVRVSFEDNGSGGVALRQENSYYAFGMQMTGSYMPSNANKKLYNAGSEWQDDIEGLADYYSTFFREYDPIIGRFNGVDPMAEATDQITTYAYADNNPVMMNDPLGDNAGVIRVIRVQPDPGYLLGLEMQRNYFLWHQAQYGGRGRSTWGIDWGATGGSETEEFGGSGGGGGRNQTWHKMTTESLRNYGRKGGLNNGRTPLEFNRIMGKMLEEAVLRSLSAFGLGVTPGRLITSTARTKATAGRRNGVIPDGIGDAISTKQGLLMTHLFVEVKAVNGSLSLSSNQYQILGLIDALSQRKKGNSTPMLAFVTTDNTSFNSDIGNYATSKGIQVVQYRVEYDGAYTIRLSYPETLNWIPGKFVFPTRPLGQAELIGPPSPDNDFDQEEVLN